MIKLNWRPYQNDCHLAIKENYKKGIITQLIVAATGVGKRLMAIRTMNHFKKILFIAHRKELIMQAFNEIEEYWPLQAGIIKGSRFEIDKTIIIASVQTLYNRLDRIDPELFDTIIIDEAHHYCSPSFLATIRHFKPKLLTGWTATPKRLDGLNLSNIFQKVVFEYPIEQGIKEGFLSPIQAYQIKTQEDISKVKRIAGDFNMKELSEKVNSPRRNKLVVNKYLEYTKGQQGIAFCCDIDHCYDLRDEFRLFGINCEAIVSDETRCPNRDELVERYLNGEIDVLCNVTILTEGFDHDNVGSILMVRPTQSETIYKQAIGRGTRLFSDDFIQKFNTNKCTVLDFVDNTGKHSLINAWELEKGIAIEDKMFIPEEHREKLLEAKEKRNREIEVKFGADKKINLLRLPEVKVWDSASMKIDLATEGQLKWIKDLGVWQEGIEYTKSMASDLISNSPAKEWQIRFLADHKYDVSGNVTNSQYQKVAWMIKEQNKYKIQ